MLRSDGFFPCVVDYSSLTCKKAKQMGHAAVAFWLQISRNVGLGALNDFRSWFWGRTHRSEQKKIAISTSRWTALSRCGVHILPTVVSILIITVNLQQVYIGIDFKSLIRSETINIALLQTTAKLQELLIVASLASIVFQLLRDELLYGDGIPLGLVGAGFDFTKLSFFWSPEMLGSVRSLFRGSRKYRKMQLVLFLILAGALALLVGPSCAVLLVPQNQDWPAGGTTLILNGTRDEFWPVTVEASPALTMICSSSDGVRYGVCPSGAYHSLWAHYTKFDQSTFRQVVPSTAKDLSGNHYYWSIESMQPVSTKAISFGETHGDHFACQPYMPVSVLLDQLMQDWWQALLVNKHRDMHDIDDRKGQSSNVFSPFAQVLCSSGKMLQSSNHKISFPTFERSQPDREVDISRSGISIEPTDHLRFSWMTLPASFESVSTGALLQSPWVSNNASRLVVGCSIRANWVPAHLRNEAYNFWSGWYMKNITFGASYPTKGTPFFNGTGKSLRNAITIDESWLKALTPPTPLEGPGYFSWGPSTIESILSTVRLTEGLGLHEDAVIEAWQPQGNTNRSDLLASVVGSVFVDGLSRFNLEKIYQRRGSPPQWTIAGYEKETAFQSLLLEGKRALKNPDEAQKDSNSVTVEFAVSGLSYRNTLAQKLAMIVLVLHIAIASSHTVWTVVRGKSSACWDSIAEILVLAQNSKPAYRELGNTAAGVRYSYTFAKKVRIRSTRLPNAQEADHLELVLQEDLDQDEMVDLEPSKALSSESARNPVIALDIGSSASVNVPHPSTWPTYQRHSSAPSIWSSESFSETHLERSESPLIASSNQSARTASSSWVKDDYAYG